MDFDGGDPSCWVSQVCSDCGAMIEASASHRCVRAVALDGLEDHLGHHGVIWSVTGPRQIEANLVVLGPGGRIDEHCNSSVDVLLVVLGGSGQMTVDTVLVPLALHSLVLVPRGSTRALTAGTEGIRYLSSHIAGTGPAITG